MRARSRVGRGDAERATDREVRVVAAVIAAGSEKAARERGLTRLEGKEYVMRDGDVAHFRFNV